MSHGVCYDGCGIPAAERVQTRRDEAAILISTLGRLLDVWVTPKELQWEEDCDTPHYIHRGVTLTHTSLVLNEGEAPIDYLNGSILCECGRQINSSYIRDENGVSALLEGRDPIALQFHRCRAEAIRNLGASCPACEHPLCSSGHDYTYCGYCGFSLTVEDDGTDRRRDGLGGYLIRYHTDWHAGTMGCFDSPEERERWTAETLAAGDSVERAYYTHQRAGTWETVYVVGSPGDYDWLSPTTMVPGPDEEPVPWPAD